MPNCILATGGAGYIGSHVVAELLAAGYRVVVLDNFENSDPSTIDRIAEIAGQPVTAIKGDVRDRLRLERVMLHHEVDAVIHLAGKKAVGESVANPLLYFNDNFNGAIALLEAMKNTGVRRLAFSSSATVYGYPESLPINEGASVGVTNPYARTKLVIEEMIDDLLVAEPDFSCISLRYFNPVGAHRSGLIGEDPRGAPNNLFPYVARTATGQLPSVQVFGDDYDTHDGTGLRDYIHVEDLARGHLAAIELLLRDGGMQGGHQRVNLGAGKGYTVLEVIDAFSRACGFDIPYHIAPRRPGDAAASVADPSRAHALLGWSAQLGLDRMCADQWAFISNRMAKRELVTPMNTTLPAAGG
ncbi:MAG: UDP-glucose 4-epimerase GalE [Pikeienuella sp.]